MTLDPTQQAVIDLAPGASGVIVGAPGSGKTETLIAVARDRVARGLVAADEVLAVTGSRRTASLLRDRLSLELAAVTSGPLALSATALAFDIVRSYRLAAGLEPVRLLSGAEHDAILRDILQGHIDDERGPQWPERLGPAVRSTASFRTELRELLMRATEFGPATGGLAALRRAAATLERPEWAAAADVADEYASVASSAVAVALDTAEIGDDAVRIVENGLAGGRIAKLRLLLVDEAHEATEVTLRLIAALAHRGVTVLAFGDPDLATNGFRGGTADAVASLRTRLPAPVSELVLSTVHRHGAEIRSVVSRATGLIGAAGAGRQRAAHGAAAEAGEAVSAIVAPGRTELVNAVARVLRERHLRDGVAWSEMLVIARRAGDIPHLERALAQAHVPTRSLGGGRALGREGAARGLLEFIAAALRPERLDGAAARALLLGPYGGFDPVALRRLRTLLRHAELTEGGTLHGDALLADALRATGRLATAAHPLARDFGLARRAAAVAERLEKLRRVETSGGTTEELVWTAWEGARLAREWRDRALSSSTLAEEAHRALDSIVALLVAARRFDEREPDRTPIDFVEQVLRAEVPEDTLAPRAAAEAVLLATPSGATGIEVDTVVLTGLHDGEWPDLRLRGSLLGAPQFSAWVGGQPPSALTDERRAVLSDELRLFALAASRATSRLVLATVRSGDEFPSPLIERVGVALPSDDGEGPGSDARDARAEIARAPLDLRGLVGALRRRLTGSVAAGAPDRAAAAALATLAEAGVTGADPAEWAGLAPITTTAPVWDLSDADTVVRVSPSNLDKLEASSVEWFIDWVAASPSGPAAGLGTIIHAAMELLSDRPAATADELWEHVEPRLGELGLDPGWESSAERRVARQHVEALAAYLARMHAAGGRLLAPEFTVQVDYPVDAATARISGKVDRVEQRSEGIVIVDLKTGSVLRAQDVAEHPQLAAYQLSYADGAFAEVLGDVAAEHPRPAAARLLFTKKGTASAPYTIRDQEPMDDDALAAFRERIRRAAREMAAGVYRAVDLPSGGSPEVRRVHLPTEVTDDE